MTPEGEQKELVREFLTALGAYQFWPVQTGMGTSTLDVLACIHGVFWGIEVKRADGPLSKRVPTQRQIIRMEEIVGAGGRVAAGPAATIIAIVLSAIPWQFRSAYEQQVDQTRKAKPVPAGGAHRAG